MKLPHLFDAPSSDALLSKYVKRVIQPAYSGVNVSLITFRGSGEMSQIKYLSEHLHKLPEHRKEHLFVLLDLSTFTDDMQEIVMEASSFFLNRQDYIKDSEVYDLFDSVYTFDQFTKAVYELTYKKNYRVTFVINNFRHVYSGHKHGVDMLATLEVVRKINPMKSSFIFVAEADFSPTQVADLKNFGDLFLQNVVSGKDLYFDEDSCVRLFEQHTNRFEYNYGDSFVQKAWENASGDPSVLKMIAMKCLSDDKFKESFLNTSSIADLYTLVGEDALNHRFSKILNVLLPDSIECLMTHPKYENPTDFLIQTGLLVADSGQFQAINAFFDHYIKANVDFLHQQGKILVEDKRYEVLPLDLRQILTAKEILVMATLVAKAGETVTKDEIAEVMWGETWEQNYSNWAIDKLLSNLRKKLSQVAYSGEIKTVKGQGFILIK